ARCEVCRNHCHSDRGRTARVTHISGDPSLSEPSRRRLPTGGGSGIAVCGPGHQSSLACEHRSCQWLEGCRVRGGDRLGDRRYRRVDDMIQVDSPSKRKQQVRAMVASAVGTSIEWYDFFLYGVAAALVFPQKYFPQSDPFVGTLLSFTT